MVCLYDLFKFRPDERRSVPGSGSVYRNAAWYRGLVSSALSTCTEATGRSPWTSVRLFVPPSV